MFSQKLFVFLLGIFFTTFAFAETTIKAAAKNFPSETVLLLHCSDRSSQSQAFSQVPLGKLLAEPQMKRLCEPFQQILMPFTEQADQMLAQQNLGSLAELWGALGGEAFLAVTGINPQGPSVVVALQLPTQEKEKLYEMLQQVLRNNAPIPAEPVNIHDLPFLAFPVQPHVSIYMGLVGDRLVITTSQESVGMLLQEPTENLASNDSFTKVFADAPTTGVSLYLNLESIWQSPMLPPEAQGVVEMLGVNSWKSLAVSWGVHQQNLRSTIAVYAPEHQNQGILNQVLASPISQSPHINHVPATSSFYMQSTSPLTMKVSGFLPILQNFIPPQMYQQYSEQLGIPALLELVQEMESEWSYFQLEPEEGSLIPYGIHLQKVKSRQAFEDKLAAMMSGWGFEKKVISFQNREIHYWQNKLGTGERYLNAAQMNIDPQLIYLLFPYRCYFFLDDKTVAYSDLVHSLKDYAVHISQKYRSLASDSDFQQRMASVGDHSAIVYRGKNNNFPVGYRVVLGLFQVIEGIARDTGIPVEIALFPQAKTIAQYLTSESVAYRSTPNGFLLMVESGGVPSLRLVSGDASAMQGSIEAVAITGIVAAIAIPNLLRSRVSANESSAQATLRNISTSQSMFLWSTIVDQDKDGNGEFGLLGELTGVDIPRGAENVVNPTYLDGTLAPNEEGVAIKNGYCFRIFLPQEVDNQEIRFIAYAWPEEANNTGHRVFVINEAGEVMACDNINGYSGTQNMPEPNAALDKANPENVELGGGFSSENSVDGGMWTPAW